MSDLSSIDKLYIRCQAALAREAGLLVEIARLKAENARLRQKASQRGEAINSALFALEQLNNNVSGLIEAQNRITNGEYNYAKVGNLPRR